MSDRTRPRWFQLSLKSLFLLTLLVATFFAGYTVATKQAEAEKRRAEEEAQQAIEEAREEAEAQAALLQAQNQSWRVWSSSGTVR